MGSRPIRLATVLALTVASWAACSYASERSYEPETFGSAVAFEVHAVDGWSDRVVGKTPCDPPLEIPPCDWWYVEPVAPVDIKAVCREVEAQSIRG